MKIYAITKGCYNYHICALTVSKEKAERLKKLYTYGDSSFYGEAMIEEFEDTDCEEVMALWGCDECGNHADLHEDDTEIISLVSDHIYFSDDGEVLGVYVIASSAEQAEKKAHDMIAEYKAKKAGIV